MDNSIVDGLCSQLRRRATRLRIGALIILFSIFISLTGGISLFLFVGKISVKESDFVIWKLYSTTENLNVVLKEGYFKISNVLESNNELISQVGGGGRN